VIRIIICDDHPIFREGVKKILKQSSDLVVEEEAASGPELVEKLAAKRFDLALLDISLPGANGVDLLKSIQADHPRLPVLMLSMYPEEQYAVRALRAGAAGYVTKGSVPTELVAAIRKVAAGGKYVSPSLAELLAEEMEGKRQSPAHEKLSDREYQILCMLGAGKGIKEIAHELYISPPTVGTYRARILAKLGLRTTAELIGYAIKQNLV
jgi:two-component system invasion response regulator UvrY